MAKQKKVRAPKREFRLAFSECGDFSQAQFATYGKPHNSIKAAKSASDSEATSWTENDNSYEPKAIFILEVVAVGKASGFSWNK